MEPADGRREGNRKKASKRTEKVRQTKMDADVPRRGDLTSRRANRTDGRSLLLLAVKLTGKKKPRKKQVRSYRSRLESPAKALGPMEEILLWLM